MEECAITEAGDSEGTGPRNAGSEGICTTSGALEQDKTFTQADTKDEQSTTSSPTRAGGRSEEFLEAKTTKDGSVVSSPRRLDSAQLVVSLEDVQHTDATVKDSNAK